MFNKELKKGSLELLILTVLEGHPRHGYDNREAPGETIGWEASLPRLHPVLDSLPHGGPGVDQGTVGREARPTAAVLLHLDS